MLATVFAGFGLSAVAGAPAAAAGADAGEAPSLVGGGEALRSVDMIRAGCAERRRGRSSSEI